MSGREKIVLGGMVVALLFAAYTFYSEPSSQKKNVIIEKELADVKALSAQLSDELQKDRLTPVQRYVLERADAEWASFCRKETVVGSRTGQGDRRGSIK
jgi:hypothetical protein